jgi:cell division protein FtsN
MRVFRFLNLAILSVLLAGSAALYEQDDKPQEDKPARQEDPKAPAKPDEGKPARPDDAKPAKDEAKPAQPDKQDEKQQKDEQKQEQQEQKDSRDQMKPEGQEHPAGQAQQGRSAGNNARIPDDKFKAHFGRGHTFKAQGVIVQGQTQFQYGGYSFILVDPWPVGWAYTDDCYIDYIDGEYFLFDLLHPGVQIAVTIVL